MKNKKLIISILICILLIECIILGIIYCSKTSNNDNIYNDSEEIVTAVDVSRYDSTNKEVLLNAMNTYCRLNNNIDNKYMANILTLADFQYLGDYESKDFDLNPFLDKINTISKLKNMDVAVTLGDLNCSTENKEVSLKNLNEITNKFKKFSVQTMFTLGNHDKFIKDNPEYDITDDEYYNITLSGLDASYKFNEKEKNQPYYYKDIEDKKMRICILNCFSEGNYEFIISKEQLKFIASEMLDFSNKENGSEWTVAFFIHTILPTEVHQEYVDGADELFRMLRQYKNGEKFVLDMENEYDFSNMQRANIAAIFTGHHHLNYTIKKEGILVIGMDSIRAIYDRGDTKLYANWSENKVDIGFEIISIDTKNRTIYSTKVGNGQNRFWNY